MYPCRPKAEAFSNAVDVVERLRDPTDPSTERTTPRQSAPIQAAEVRRTPDPLEPHAHLAQQDRAVTVIGKLPT